jgi:primosomal protein N' (replication factor Y)
MPFAEIIVNVPIRRGFRAEEPPAPDEPDAFGSSLPDDESTGLQAFHYHLPPGLDSVVQPGHLVWVSFGAREVQGFVLALSDHSPVPTKPVLRLARPDPVLTPAQLELAAWISREYVAAPAEAAKLFLPPGLLVKENGTTGVRAKREWQVRWVGGQDGRETALAALGRDTKLSRALAWLLSRPQGRVAADDLIAAADGDRGVLRGLVEKGLVAQEGDRVRLAQSPAQTQAALYVLRRVDKYVPVLDALSDTIGPIWKSELSSQTPVDLATLRALQQVGVISLDEGVRFRDPLNGRFYPATRPPQFTGEQAAVWARLRSEGMARLHGVPAGGEGAAFLLHGVTGSGKTEIYLAAIGETLAAHRQAIVLVPEIALTPQTVARFAGRFPGRVTVVHSGLSAGERYDVWRKVREGAFDVVVGPRSALFAPLDRLGLIVVDEEHEPSYKQDAEVWGGQRVFFDARMVARRMAQVVGGVVIFGSATPSLEATYAVEQGRMTLLRLPRRVLGHVAGDAVTPAGYGELPPVEIVDMRLELRAGNRSVLSRSLQAELHATLDAGRQAILFLNRRGSNTFVICRDCGSVERCTRCDVPLTYHERAEQLVCHHCSQRYPIPTFCLNCGSKRIRYFGTGTQRIEDLVQEIAPRARVLRWDADTAAGKGGHEAILDRFARHDADVLVGTQMIAKGLDLPLVTLVGVVAADVSLYLPDFRAGERTFQLLTQVAGRAGRSRHGGRVVIQSYTPDHYVIQAAAQHDYAAFYRRELGFRSELRYPPLRRMARLVYWDKKPDKAQSAAETMAETVRVRLTSLGVGSPLGAAAVTLVGPAPAFFARFRGYYRWQILLVADDPAAILRGIAFPFGWRVDVDPVTVL